VKIVSLLPGLTELVCALGLEDRLKGRSHECDHPGSVTALPALTSANYRGSAESDSRHIHDSVMSLLHNALSIYDVDEEKLIEIDPDIILTQDHCEVCAVSYGDLSEAVKETLGRDTKIISASPTSLNEICRSFIDIAAALGVRRRGEELVMNIQSRFDEIRKITRKLSKPNVVAIEWIDPIMTGGNWMPEMIEIAGGVPHLAKAGEHSPWCNWEDIVSIDPDILLVLPCGYGINKTLSEMSRLTKKEHWRELTAVRQQSVYILDGNHYFNRPGPRIRNSVEILTEIFHPDQFGCQNKGNGWIRFGSSSGSAGCAQ